MEVKEKILKLLKERGWSKSKLAKESGISEHAVYNWFNEKNYTPSRDAIEDVCSAFGITLAQFYTDIDVDKLDARELELLELFRQIPPNKRNAVFEIVKTFIEKSN